MSQRDVDLPVSKDPRATIYRRVDRWLTGPIGSLGFLLMLSVAGWLIASAFQG